MLKFKYLFNNPDLAEMLVKNWDYDLKSLELFNNFRISANAIYPFRIKGEICYLRFCPVSEKLNDNLLSELEFMNYLHSRAYPAMEVMRTKSGDELVRKKTPWGEYYASVFKRVAGKQISQTDYNDDIMFAYGAALGELHALSSQYEKPTLKRWTHSNVFDWIEKTLGELGLDQETMLELALLRREFNRLPINQGNYGLIHYDFEPDNVFYDESTRQCSVIDFDDAMYHWYVMDIVQALFAIQDEMDVNEISHQEAVFLKGYRSVFEINDHILSKRLLFRRFANLYQYARLAKAKQEQWENEPAWMIDLRGKLERLLLDIRLTFGE